MRFNMINMIHVPPYGVMWCHLQPFLTLKCLFQEGMYVLPRNIDRMPM